MKKSLILTSLLIGAISFNGCGSSSDGGGGGGDNPHPGSNNISLSVSPLTNKNICDPTKLESAAGSYDVKFATDGDIIVSCSQSSSYSFGEYKLASGIQTLTIVDAKKVENYAIDVTHAKGTSIDTYNYKSGAITHKVNGTFNGKSINYNCTEIYPSPLPTTLTDTSSIDDLLDWEGDSNNRISSDCPTSYYSDLGKEDATNKGSVKFIENYTLTDNNGKKHLITNSGEIILK